LEYYPNPPVQVNNKATHPAEQIPLIKVEFASIKDPFSKVTNNNITINKIL